VDYGVRYEQAGPRIKCIVMARY